MRERSNRNHRHKEPRREAAEQQRQVAAARKS
jgi:hypothetical protein